MRSAIALSMLLWFAVGLPAQVPPLLVPVPTADTVVVVVVFEYGFADDPPWAWGAARMCAEVRLMRARSALPAGSPVAAHVAEDRTVVFGAVRADAATAAVAFASALVGNACAASDDELLLARARAALAADDDAWRLPGAMLQSRARAALFADGRARPLSGDPATLLRLDSGAMRDLLARPVSARCAAFGAVDGIAAALAAVSTPVVARVPAGVGSLRPPPSGLDVTPHPLVDAPFVALAFPAPLPEHATAFAVGVELAKVRAAGRLPTRPEQLRARAPTISWSWLDGDPVVVFLRRARRPGPPEPVLQELLAFVAELRAVAPTAAEVERAGRVLLAEAAPLPWPAELLQSLGSGGAALPGRAVQALLAAGRGVERSRIADVDGTSVARAMSTTLDPEWCWRGAVVPMPVATAAAVVR